MNDKLENIFHTELPRKMAADYLEKLAKHITGSSLTFQAGANKAELPVPRIARMKISVSESIEVKRLEIDISFSKVSNALNEKHLIF